MSEKLSSENRQQVSVSTFTPGPWLWRVESEFVVEENKPYGGGLLIAEICRVPEEQRRANARLIAAAPELYDACERALSIIPDRGGFHSTTSMVRVRLSAALAHARGDA